MIGLGVVAGVIGLLVVLIVAVSLLGTKAEPRFTQIGVPVGNDGLPGGARGDTRESVEKFTTTPNPEGSQVDDPIRVIEGTCRDAAGGTQSMKPWAAFNALKPGGQGQYAQVIRIGEYGPVWVASVNLASGAIEDGSDPDRLTEMARQTAVVVCAHPSTYIQGRKGMMCPYRERQADGTERQLEKPIYGSRRPVQAFEMTSGHFLGGGDADSGAIVCPPQIPDSEPETSPDVTDLELATWASQHLKGGRFQ